jgi:DNA invertase Pin-like site-specific DNA recombinase
MTTSELRQAARNLRAARSRLDAVMVSAKDFAVQAHADGMPETEIAKLFDVNRMTVRRWLGKL